MLVKELKQALESVVDDEEEVFVNITLGTKFGLEKSDSLFSTQVINLELSTDSTDDLDYCFFINAEPITLGKR